jgi:hypothetical protein
VPRKVEGLIVARPPELRLMSSVSRNISNFFEVKLDIPALSLGMTAGMMRLGDFPRDDPMTMRYYPHYL